jgi:hypothetical protein
MQVITNFTLRPVYYQGKYPHYQSNSISRHPTINLDRGRVKKTSSSSGNQTPVISILFNCLSNWVVEWETNELEFNFGRGKEIFLFSTAATLALGPTLNPSLNN